MKQSTKDYVMGAALGLTSMFGIAACILNNSGIPLPTLEDVGLDKVEFEVALTTAFATATSTLALFCGTIYAGTIGEAQSKRIFLTGNAVFIAGMLGTQVATHNFV